ncbi:hypothetical protein BUALT_Bualt14G0010900 [Buddleja alternifolia]|uniref:Uncharacterized protein n=1 Tax=Buddleja alternifolia TaxID=168488 RepID=A0AAV6WPD6_9LAMI|nr:hypothetical protein BUALT_Bualt14G0010900 [Buddleja alternifolia]
MEVHVNRENLIKRSSYSFKIICFFLLVLARAVSSQNARCPFQYLYHFGDGFTDIGNSIHVRPSESSNPASRLPYGITTPGRPTGRWSDGLIDFDYASADFGLPHITPYLSMNVSVSYDGVIFSVARSPVLDRRFFASRGVRIPSYAISLSIQLNWFKKYLNSICSTQTDCAKRLENSLLLMGDIEGNDIGYPLAQGKSIDEVRNYVPYVIRAIINGTRMLIRMGAKLIIIPGNAPLGCYPYILTALPSNDSTAYDDLGCLKSVNNLILSKNNDLQQAMDELRKEFPNVTINYGPNGELALKACCGIGGKYNYDRSRFCGSPGVPVCPYPNQYIYWDGLHMTNLAYSRVATLLIKPSLVTLNCSSQSSAFMWPITDSVQSISSSIKI